MKSITNRVTQNSVTHPSELSSLREDWDILNLLLADLAEVRLVCKLLKLVMGV